MFASKPYTTINQLMHHIHNYIYKYIDIRLYILSAYAYKYISLIYIENVIKNCFRFAYYRCLYVLELYLLQIWTETAANN